MEKNLPICNVILIGFHHKKGCQIEYSYPPLDIELELSPWKHLPTLAVPDGAHNFAKDSVYFHLPSLKDPNETIFGVACYQQIDADKVKNKTEDITRSTVQKSVCVLSKYPLFGHIQVKMALITACFFREADFEKISILEEAYHNLNSCLTVELLYTPEAFVGLSPRELIFTFRHQIIILFKLLLLEKRILFRGASVGPLCSALMTLVSLLPQTLEHGLKKSACIRTSKAMSIVPQFSGESEDNCSRSNSIFYADHPPLSTVNEGQGDDPGIGSQAKEPDLINKVSGSGTSNISAAEAKQLKDYYNLSYTKENSIESVELKSSESDGSLAEKCEDVPDFNTAVQMSPSDAGLPLHLFENGYLLHPYLSLHYLDLLTDSRVRGFVVGATNVLFKQKKDLVDVVVEMEDGSIDIADPILRRNVTPTTADLRFAEFLVKQVTQESNRRSDNDTFLDGIGWEGGDEWIRSQFKYYLICMMRTSLVEEGHKQRDNFYGPYLASWQNTHNWKKWNEYINAEERDTPGVYSICPGHPYDGNISMADMKIRLATTFQNTESGRKINQAVGKAVANTSKAVGGALTQAKGAVSSWFTSMTTTSIIASNPTPATTPIEEEKASTMNEPKE